MSTFVPFLSFLLFFYSLLAVASVTLVRLCTWLIPLVFGRIHEFSAGFSFLFSRPAVQYMRSGFTLAVLAVIIGTLLRGGLVPLDGRNTTFDPLTLNDRAFAEYFANRPTSFKVPNHVYANYHPVRASRSIFFSLTQYMQYQSIKATRAAIIKDVRLSRREASMRLFQSFLKERSLFQKMGIRFSVLNAESEVNKWLKKWSKNVEVAKRAAEQAEYEECIDLHPTFSVLCSFPIFFFK